LTAVGRANETARRVILRLQLRGHCRLAIEHPGRSEPLADLRELLAAVVGHEHDAARFVLEREQELHLRIGPVGGTPVDVNRILVGGPPVAGGEVAEGNRHAVNEREEQPLRLASGVDEEAAGVFGAALEGLLAEPLPGLAMVVRSEDAAIAEIDDELAGGVIDDDAAQSAEAGLLGSEQFGSERLPVGGVDKSGGGERNRNDNDEQTHERPQVGWCWRS